MTFKTDLAAIVPTAAAKAAFIAKGTDIVQLVQNLQRCASEMQILLKQVIAFHPNDSVITATVNAGGSGGTNHHRHHGDGDQVSSQRKYQRRRARGQPDPRQRWQLHGGPHKFIRRASDRRKPQRRNGGADHDRRQRDHRVAQRRPGGADLTNQGPWGPNTRSMTL